jgi:hypothetical protein
MCNMGGPADEGAGAEPGVPGGSGYTRERKGEAERWFLERGRE